MSRTYTDDRTAPFHAPSSAPGLHIQLVDRLVRHMHLRIGGKLATSQPEICSGDQRSSTSDSTIDRNLGHATNL